MDATLSIRLGDFEPLPARWPNWAGDITTTSRDEISDADVELDELRGSVSAAQLGSVEVMEELAG